MKSVNNRLKFFILQSYPKWLLIAFFFILIILSLVLFLDRSRQIDKVEEWKIERIHEFDQDRRDTQYRKRERQNLEASCLQTPDDRWLRCDYNLAKPVENIEATMKAIDQRETAVLASLDQEVNRIRQGQHIFYGFIFWIVILILVPVFKLILLLLWMATKKSIDSLKIVLSIFRSMNVSHQWIIVLLVLILLAIILI